MITKNPTQLKAFIKKKAVEKNISAQLVMQHYMLEQLMARISKSKYKKNFIIKGGFLISAIVGLDTRTTMDLDTTLKGLTLTQNEIEKIFKEICDIQLEDDINFIVDRTENIRETDDYSGIRVFIFGEYAPIKTPITVDVTTGDKITPKEIEYTFKCIFDDSEISIMAYNLETIFSEKIETILSRSITNTRPRDFYDIYILYKLRWKDINIKMLECALRETMLKRNTEWIMADKMKILGEISLSDVLENRWDIYRKKYEYAKDIDYTQIMQVLKEILNLIK